MTTLAEVLAEVYNITNRPDLVTETTAMVKMATLKAHHTDFYPRDLVESGLAWSTPAYYQSLEYRTLFPRFRALKYLRKYDTVGSAAGVEFTVVTPEQIFDSYSIERTDVCYLAGEALEIKSSTKDTNMLIGFYQTPDVANTTYSSWVADMYMYAIVFEAARAIFKQTGWDEQSSAMNAMVQEQYIILRSSNILVTGG